MKNPVNPFLNGQPVMEALFALHRVALTGAEALAELHVEGVRHLSKQAAAASDSLPEADAVAPWIIAKAQAVPQQAQDALGLSRRAYSICATSTANWMGVCAEQTHKLSRHSLDAVDTLIKMAPGEHKADTQAVRQSLESANRSYFAMLDAFRNAAESLARTDTAKRK